MTKFNVGDSLEFIEKYGSYEIGDKVTVTGCKDDKLIHFDGKRGTGCALESRFKLSDKPTKNQRITALENELAETKNEVAELKLIVHQIRESKVIDGVSYADEPSTIVEDIIEFEGARYYKVDREAHKGVVVIFHKNNTRFFTNGEPYKVAANGCPIDNEEEAVLPLYSFERGRTPETVDVYELIEAEPLTPNQQRAQIIEKAKKFIEENLKLLISYDLVVSGNALKLYSHRRYQDIQLTTAKCNISDVFNEHIGKAITLGRALGLDVSEFEQAVQPTEPEYGMIVLSRNPKDGLREISPNYVPSKTCHLGSDTAKYGKIINDTNAQYGGVE